MSEPRIGLWRAMAIIPLRNMPYIPQRPETVFTANDAKCTETVFRDRMERDYPGIKVLSIEPI